jgi:hypothetical protein
MPNPPTRDRAALTLSRDGHTATVKVGDVVPLVSAPGEVTQIDEDGRLWVDGWLYSRMGIPYNARRQDIDIAALTRPTAPGDDLVARSAARVERDIDDMHAALSGKPFGPLDDPTDTAPGDGLAGVVVTEAMRREIAITTERLANTPLRDPIWMQKWGEHINALMAANLLPAPKEPTT